MCCFRPLVGAVSTDKAFEVCRRSTILEMSVAFFAFTIWAASQNCKSQTKTQRSARSAVAVCKRILSRIANCMLIWAPNFQRALMAEWFRIRILKACGRCISLHEFWKVWESGGLVACLKTRPPHERPPARQIPLGTSRMLGASQ